MKISKRFRRAISNVELLVGMAVITLTATVAAEAVFHFGRTNEEYLWRRTAGWAAQAQLERLQAGAALESLPPPGLLPTGITLKTTASPGSADWAGFQRVTVIATAAMPSGRTARETVDGYVRTEVNHAK